MSDGDVFERYGTAVDALRSEFGRLGDKLFAGETVSQYALSVGVDRADREKEADRAGDDAGFTLEQGVPVLAESLLAAGFGLTLTVRVRDFQAELAVRGVAAGVEFDGKSDRIIDGLTLERLPPEKVGPFEVLQEALRSDATGIALAQLCGLLDGMDGDSAGIDLSLHIFLDKTPISRALAKAAGTDAVASKVVSYLFPEALVRRLREIRPAELEKDFFQQDRRSVVVVFGFNGWIGSETLVICGRDHGSRLAELVRQPLAEETLKKVRKTLEFRMKEGLWAFPTTWLTPDTFELDPPPAGETGVGSALRLELRGFQALFATIFLGDRVEGQNGATQVEFKGYGRSRFVVSRGALVGYEPKGSKALYELYAYAFDGFSTDKLDIAQRFLSLSAKDAKSLCDNAVEIREATEMTYGQVLAGKVEAYFDARHKVQERIKTAIAETAEATIAMTGDVSADLYKVAGLLAAAIVATLFKPDLSARAILVAALTIMVYLGLVISYHLKTIEETHGLSIHQHRQYIDSFRDVLRPKEIDASLGSQELRSAEAAFANRYGQAEAIYKSFFAVALVVAIVSLLIVVGSISRPVVTSTLTPAP